jgi:hypothetical protein
MPVHLYLYERYGWMLSVYLELDLLSELDILKYRYVE